MVAELTLTFKEYLISVCFSRVSSRRQYGQYLVFTLNCLLFIDRLSIGCIYKTTAVLHIVKILGTLSKAKVLLKEIINAICNDKPKGMRLFL